MLPKLYYKTGEDFAILPEWAYFFMNLGYMLGAERCVKYRYVVGLAVPTRAFGCSFVTTGVILSRASIEASTDDIGQQNFILNQAPGTPVYIYRENNRKLRGIIEGFAVRNGIHNVIVQTTESEQRWYPLDKYASRITISDKEVRIPANQQIGRKIDPFNSFLESVIGADLAQEYALRSSLEAIVVGKMLDIRHDVCEASFFCQASTNSNMIEGHLQDIIRVRQFSGANSSFYTQCISPSHPSLDDEIGEREPAVAIFDGATAFFNHGQRWRQAHHIVLLDRTERQFFDAVELMNQNYAYRFEESTEFNIKIPDGIEMMLYKEQK